MLLRFNSVIVKSKHQLPPLTWSYILLRDISTELTNALRPFYFAVHPDFFGQHPMQRNVNENSLKLLSAHMESLYERKYQSLYETKTLQFYIRDGNASSRDTFKLIKVTLDRSTNDPKLVVQRLLELCNLPTDYVKSIKSMPVTAATSATATAAGFANAASSFKAGTDYNYGSQFSAFESAFYNTKKEQKKTLDSWLKKNAPLAKLRTAELDDLKEEVKKLQQAVTKRLDLRDIRYDCGWNYEHFRGCLKSLERMTDLHGDDMGALKNRILVFAPFTGVSLEGHIMLFTGDVLTSWIDFIKNIPKHDEFLKRVPFYENTLSQVLRNIKIGRRKFMPKQQAREYAAHLIKVTTTLGDYLTVNKFPKSWPPTLENYEIVIESEAGPLMVNPTGQLIAPATCPGFMLIDFITANLDIAKERTEKYQTQKTIERKLNAQCIQQLRLQTLTKDDSVTPDKMIETMNKLLTYNDKRFRELNLHITNYYSVLTDGIVCIPWDFEPR
ncbi:T-cell activation inhibitor, mitochondrial [Anastrepha obliqua]|uniref:T-cell activation inhibitor, mitochondrial n=1 Tax=Anastrepha obliqua TaxID=95512 RepID=UPI00240978BF|nr:T-cell activation inhibitor, mitochondrial [Anastrepha obliqua]XP_054731828.1 T-cell activation inhibitor, mitochondrial [Anastrepha obliqua]XP_054731829.1 T-cell activation inhibitor, mitochondrial [Anastrepha obliqua]